MKKIEKFGPFVLAFVIFLVGLNAVYNMTTVNFKERDGQVFSRVKQISKLKKEDRQIDVLYVGESKVQLGISPMKVYEQSNLTGLNLASSAQPIYLTKELIDVYSRKFNPKAVVIEGLGWNTDIKPELGTRPYFYKYGIDLLPSHKDKIKFLNNLSERGLSSDVTEMLRNPFDQMMTFSQNVKSEDKIELFRFSKGMKKYPYETSALGYTNLREIDPNVDDAHTLKLEGIPPVEIPNSAIEELIALKKMLDERDIKLVVISMPSFSNNELEMTSLDKKCEELNIDFIDFLQSENLESLNFDSYGDYQNYAHLTLNGSQKLSALLGEKLNDIVIPKEKTADEIKFWDDMLLKNKKFVEKNKQIHDKEIELIKTQNNLN